MLESFEPSTLAALWSALRLGVEADLAVHSPGAVALHALRRLAALGQGRRLSELVASPSLRAHAGAVERGDPLFCLAHRNYLATGLTRAERLTIAHDHYRAVDSRLSPALRAAVAAPDGAELWRHAADGHLFDLRLGTGRDVGHEGGLSVLLRIDGGPLSVLSFSLAPRSALRLPAGKADWLPFVTRKQTSRDLAARAAFDRAFDRANPASLTWAGFEALARHLGADQALGVAAERHPSWTPDLAPQFANSYDAFWQGMGGVAAGPFGQLIPLPADHASHDDQPAQRRARAQRRRAHAEAAGVASARALADLSAA